MVNVDNPVSLIVGKLPRSPFNTVFPVFVKPLPSRAANPHALPRSTGRGPANSATGNNIDAIKTKPFRQFFIILFTILIYRAINMPNNIFKIFWFFIK